MFKEKYGMDTTGLTRRGNDKSVDPQQHYKMLYNKILVTVMVTVTESKIGITERAQIHRAPKFFEKAEKFFKKFLVDSLNSFKAVYG